MEMEDMSLEVAEKDTAAEIAAEAAVADPANRPAKRSSNTRVRLISPTRSGQVAQLRYLEMRCLLLPNQDMPAMSFKKGEMPHWRWDIVRQL
jgi:hypothetical protein